MVVAISPMPTRALIEAATRVIMVPARVGEARPAIIRDIPAQVAALHLLVLPIEVGLQPDQEVRHPARVGAARRGGHRCLATEHRLRHLRVRPPSLVKACAHPLRHHELSLRLRAVLRSPGNPVAAR